MRILLAAVAVELALLVAFLAVPPVAGLLGGSLPGPLGWAVALSAVPAVILADAGAKRLARHR